MEKPNGRPPKAAQAKSRLWLQISADQKAGLIRVAEERNDSICGVIRDAVGAITGVRDELPRETPCAGRPRRVESKLEGEPVS